MIIDGDDFICFDDLQDMTMFMEPWQFEEEADRFIYVDANQQILKFAVEALNKRPLWQGRVVYVGIDEEKKIEDVEDLRHRLAEYVSARTKDISFLDVSWERLVQVVEEKLLVKYQNGVSLGQILRNYLSGVFRRKT
jgi:hypothetical protein